MKLSEKDSRFFLIAGPCAIENEKTPHLVAERVDRLCKERNIPYIFKGSYRKANRTRRDSFTGIGDEKALQILAGIRKEFNVAVTTDIHLPEEAAMAAEYVDILQIPAFLCRQTELLEAAGKTGKWVSIKKGQFAAPSVMKYAAEKVTETGNEKVMLIERGTSFGYGDLVVDYRSIPEMSEFGFPIVLDCTHSLQKPNQSVGVTGGRPDLISTIASAGIAAGADGLFIETHPNPENALSDGKNMLHLDKLEKLLDKLVKIYDAVQG